MKFSSILFVFYSLLSLSTIAHAGDLEFKIGPPGVGAGGTNPVSIPPTIADIEANYLTDDWQYTFSVAPGMLMGKRFYNKNYFGTLGGGLIFNANGFGIGPYVGLGYRSGGSNGLSFVAEFKQALGYSSRWISPYAFRMGVGYAF